MLQALPGKQRSATFTPLYGLQNLDGPFLAYFSCNDIYVLAPIKDLCRQRPKQGIYNIIYTAQQCQTRAWDAKKQNWKISPPRHVYHVPVVAHWLIRSWHTMSSCHVSSCRAWSEFRFVSRLGSRLTVRSWIPQQVRKPWRFSWHT